MTWKLPRGGAIDAYVLQAQAGDGAAANVVAQAMCRLVYNSVIKFVRRSGRWNNLAPHFDDLVGEAWAELARAIGRFRSDGGATFVTFATTCIGNRLKSIIFDVVYPVRVPAYLNHKDKTGKRKITFNHPAIKAARARPVQLGHERARGDDDGATFELPDPRLTANPTARLEAEELRAQLVGLTDRQRVVVELRFGLDGRGERTLDEVAPILGVSRERARQIEKAALKKLRYLLEDTARPARLPPKGPQK